MAINNSLQPQRSGSKPTLNDRETSFVANGQTVKLTPELVKKYLVSGDPNNVTMQEVVMFINLCKFNGLNPWLKEAYCIKYGTSPATIVPSKDAFQKRADSDANYDGQSAGIIVLTADGEVEHRDGCFYIDGEQLLGGWAKVWRKDRAHPYSSEVALGEYIGKKRDGTVNSQWSGKPATMIRKVALVQALREAFPAKLGAMYSAEEQGVTEPVIADFELQPDAPEEQQKPQPKTAPKLAPHDEPKNPCRR